MCVHVRMCACVCTHMCTCVCMCVVDATLPRSPFLGLLELADNNSGLPIWRIALGQAGAVTTPHTPAVAEATLGQ